MNITFLRKSVIFQIVASARIHCALRVCVFPKVELNDASYDARQGNKLMLSSSSSHVRVWSQIRTVEQHGEAVVA